jgi:hypothetical protein
MSALIKEGHETTEHARAVRAEVLGAALVALGAILACLGSWPGVAVAGIGAVLVGWVHSAYARSRGEVKAAGVRKPVDVAPRRA